MDDGPGLSCKPKSFGMRIILITHANSSVPDTSGGKQTDELARRLSGERVENTRSILENALRRQLGDEVEIETIVSNSEVQRPRIVDTSAFGFGNVEPLRRGRSEDPELGRRLKVIVEKIATSFVQEPGTHPLRVSAVNKNWHVTLQRLRLIATGTMPGTADLTIRNALSGKLMKGMVTLSGGPQDCSNAEVKEDPDRQFPKGIAINYVGTKGVVFVTASDMRFADFNNQFVRIEHIRNPMGVGSGLLCLTFDSLGDYARQLKIAEGLRLGLPNIEPFAVSGQLRMIGDNPGDYWVTDMTSYGTGEVERSWRDSLSLLFPPENAELDSRSRTELEDSARTWGKRFWQ